ncbi:VanZ family protein [Variovorax paradoxus]|uniref:VanZ family protein n=1 Tax=Variovorax paradoxus TaxID=34073 RepID=UPI0039999C9A
MIKPPAVRKSVWRYSFWVCAVGILVMSLAPISTPMPTTGWDKSNHTLAFAVLALLGRWAWPGRTAVVLSALLAYGGLIELLQSFTPDRFAEATDVLADAVGLLLGAGFAFLLERWRPARKGAQ